MKKKPKQPRRPNSNSNSAAATQRARVRGRGNGASLAQRRTTVVQQGLFLAAFGRLGVVTAAAIESGIDRNRHYEWLADPERFPDYRARFEDASERATDLVEQEARRRAIEGWEEPVFGRLPGKDAGEGEIGSIRKYSDTMLALVLKGRRPKVFRDRMSLSGDPDAPPIRTANTPGLTRMSDDELDQLEALIDKARGKRT